MGTDNTGAPVVTPPPAPSLDQLYGPQGGLVAAPPAPPATIPDTDNQSNAATRAVSSFESASGLPPGTPKEYAQNLGQGAKEMVTHPVEAAKLVGGGMLDAQADQTRQGNDAFKRGDYGQALAHYIYGGIPIAGPIMARAAEQIQNKDYAGAAGTIAAVITPAAEEHVAPEAAARLTEAGADIKASAQRALEAKAPVGSTEAGKIDLSSVGGTKVGDARRSPNTFGRTPNTSFGETVNRTFQAERDRAETAKPTSIEEKLPEGDYVYHATDVSRAPNIRENGLKPKSWYANSPEEAMKSGAVPISGNRADLRVFAVPKAEIEPVAPDAADMGAREVEKGRFTMSGKAHQPIEVTQDGRPLSPLPVDLTDLGSIPLTTSEGKPFTTGEPDAANELPVPANYKKNFENGFTWSNVRAHEAGHAITADSVGFGVDAMYSHLDPKGSAGGLASQQVNYAGGDNPIQGAKEIPGSGGKYSLPLDSVRARLGDMLTVLMGGGVAQEHIGGIPFDSNPGLVGDMSFAKQLMKALDIPDDQQSELLQSAQDRAKTVLTHPAADGIIQKYTQTRAEGTPDALHMTADRVNDMVREHREARNGKNGVSTQDNTAGHGEAVNRVGEKPVAGREGKGARGSDQSTQGRLFTTHEVNPEEEGDESFNFGANEKSPTADIPESKRTPTSPESKGTPTNEAAESAQRYNAAKGQPQINHEAPPLNEGRAQALAAEMDTHAHEPNTPAVKKAYKSLISDVKEQWNHAQKDMGIKFEPSEKDPYASYDEVKKDVEDNKHMSIYTGGNPLPEDHPLAQVDPKTGLTYNTMLRGVHDLYGHIAGNNDFSEQGEAGATNAHRQMMSPASVPALLNETEGQVSQYFHGKEKGGFPPQNATIVPENFVKDWHQEAGERAAKEEAGGIDPRTGTSATEGVGSEILPERRQALDHAPTPADFKAFYEANRDVLDKNPDLKIGWDNNSKVPGGHEINIGIVGDDAARLAKKLDQTSAFDIGKGEVIPTKGSGLRTEFPNYSLEERIKDAKGEPLSNVKDFEHLSKDFYDNLEPDEREYLKGNKLLQRNAMSQYHKIDPSVAETTNAMASGAALGGWWQRYMDVFHDLTGAQAQEAADHIGPAHSEILKQWHAAVSGNKSVDDANNLAWHSYADWLDAGKPTDRTSINNIVKQNGAQPEGSAKKGNGAISDTLDKNGKILSEGLDTSKLFKLVNSPEMRGERPFSNDAFNEKTPNALVAKTEGARKIPSMGATVAGKGNLNRLVIDAHIRDFYGYQNSSGPAAQYIADSVHLRQAAEALGLKGGEGQEQLWGTVLGLKQLLKTGLTPEEAAGKLNSDVINQIGKDYAEVIANDSEITKPGGLLDRLKEKYGVGSGSAGVGEANRKASASRAGQAESRSSQTPVDKVVLSQTAQRILGQISESKIKNPTGNPNDIGTVVSKFTKSKESYDILDRTGGKGGTWTSGGCWILADAVQKEYGGKLVAITTPEGRVQHIGTQIGNKIIDADGATSPEKWRDFWEKTEQVTGAKVAPLDPNKVPDGIPPPEKHDEIRFALRTQTSTPAPVPPPSRKISVPEPVEDKYTLALKAGDAAAKAKRAANMKKGISGLSKPPQK